MKQNTKTVIEKFLNDHIWDDTSPATLFCVIFESEDLVLKEMQEGNGIAVSEEDVALKNQLLEIDSADALVNLMRRPMVLENKILLMSKLILHEADAMPLIRKRILTSGVYAYAETATEFMVRCTEDSCAWILQNYKSIRNPYMQSMLLLVMGYRGTEEMVPILMNETLRFEKQYPNEPYCQAPALALERLYARTLAEEKT